MTVNDQTFRQELGRLNLLQRKAVDSIEGPVMVNAGPGTGKTQVLALRIGNILTEADIDPVNILCLTYTENGATEMRKRLLSIIGTAAYKVQIHTFHSFCNEVIQDNLGLFGKSGLEPVSDLEEMELLYRLIDSMDQNNPLKRNSADPYHDRFRLKSLFSLMKKEAWSIEFLKERIDAYVSELPTKEGFYYKRNYKTFKAGEPKQSDIDKETDKMNLLKAAVDLYPRYQRMMADAERYTFDDMILWVLDAFEKHPDLLLNYQERMQYMLVDEFQDTSRAQNLLLTRLAAYWPAPNLFVVGDGDQSIFSFQDANVGNMLEFEKRFHDELCSITLRENYRSTQPILDAAHQLITENKIRIVGSGETAPLLCAQANLAGIDTPPQITVYPNPIHEAVDVVRQIEALINQGISGKEIAVIYRNHEQVEEIIRLLEIKNIPVNTRRKTDLLKTPFIDNIITLLTWIDRERYIPYSADDLLFRLLHCDFFGLAPLDVARISVTANEKNRNNEGEKYSIRRLLAASPLSEKNLFSDSNKPTAKEISEALEELITDAGKETLQQLIENTIRKTGILRMVLQSAHKPWLMQCLQSFYTFIKEENRRNQSLTLHGLLANFERMKDNRIAIPLFKVTATEAGVNMVTAHSAKGSEFSFVFLIGCSRDIWDEGGRKGKGSFKMPDNLVNSVSAADTLEESRRLFYVAITRAKTHLYISYPEKNHQDKALVCSSFVTELATKVPLGITPKTVPDEFLIDHIGLQFTAKAKPRIELMEKEYIGSLLKKYSLSITHLNNYLDCPLKFYYQNLIKVPGAKNEFMAFGSAVHYAMEILFTVMKKNSDVFPPADELLGYFKRHMHMNREAFTPEQYERRLAYGEKILPEYYNQFVYRWNKIVAVEKAIRQVVVNQVPLNGKLDKIEFNRNEVNVVDYKTGSYKKAKEKLEGPSDKSPNGGDYWRQAVFYKILVDNDTTNTWTAISAEFDFVEPVDGEYKQHKIIVTEADITTVKQQITDTWQKIQRQEFHTGCGKEECGWCTFVKSNKLATALVDPDEETTEDLNPPSPSE